MAKHLLLFILISANTVFAVKPDSVIIEANWRPGEIKYYQLTHNRIKTENKKAERYSSQYDIVIKVNAIQDSGFVLEWRYRNIQPEQAGKNPLADKLAKLTEDIPIKYQVDNKGRFVALVNWMEIRDQIFKAADKVTSSRPDKETEKAMTFFKGIYSSQKNIESIALADIRLFHAMHGFIFADGRKDIYSAQLPNMYGGSPFYAQTTQTLATLDTVMQIAEIKTQTTIDRKKSHNTITELTDRLVQENKNLDSRNIRINIEDETYYTFYLTTGWIKQARFKRVIDTNELQNTDNYILKEMTGQLPAKKQ